MTDSSYEESVNPWVAAVRARFPDWQTPEALQRWTSVFDQLKIGHPVSGEVIARAHFGVWVDFGVSFPGLLLVTNMEDAGPGRITVEEYPPIGSLIDGRINSLGLSGEIGLTQRRPDPMIEKDVEHDYSMPKQNRPSGM